MRLFIVLLTFTMLLNAQDNSWMLYDDSQVAVVEITTSPEAVDFMYTNPWSDSLHLASVHFKNAMIDETIDSVGIRLRGNTSRDSQKKSFKLDFEHFVDGREFYSVDKLNLNGEHNDPSIMRSKISWEMFHQAGLISSRAAHTAVYINDKYYGLYLSVEHYDKEFIRKNFKDASGNLYKCLYPADLVDHSDDPENYPEYPKHTPNWDAGRRVYELKTNEAEDDYSKLERFLDIVNNTPSYRFSDSLEAVLDVPAAIKMMAMDVLLGSWDDYWANINNFYMYHEPENDKFYIIPYDYDNTMGIDWFAVDWDQADPYEWPRLNWDFRPLVENILAVPKYHDFYTHFLEFYSQNVFDLSLWDERLTELKNQVSVYAEADTFKFRDWGFTNEDFNNSYDSYSNQHVTRGLRQYVNNRNASLGSYLYYQNGAPYIYACDYYPKNPTADDTIYVEISAFAHPGFSALELQYQIGENSPFLKQVFTHQPVADSKRIEDADRWVAKLPPLKDAASLRFIVYALANSQILFYPKDAIAVNVTGTGQEGVLINEFLASNTTVNVDENAQYEDWLELYNSNEDTVDLSGYFLTDKDTTLNKWRIPDGTKIAPKGFLLFWCDEDQSQGPLHTNFKISAGGEFLALVAPDAITVYDSLSFGPQVTDISYGRNPDGSANWEFALPTPGYTNVVTAIKDNTLLPVAFEMLAYPNPFNNTLSISYSLPVENNVDVQIFDILGRQVWQKMISHQHPGKYAVKWQGAASSGLAAGSGVFIVKISAGKFQKTQKVLLIK
ncbi:MAG: CotH kinase family protein [Calditrichae bacterium]|nr:CotH kinase family protein [Calditrichia bacterium]